MQLHHDFRAEQLNRAHFDFDGPNAKSFVVVEREGLRITLPADSGPDKPVGIRLRQDVIGDFKVTVEYQFVELGEPTRGHGAGVSVYVILKTPAKDRISLGRFVHHKHGHIFMLSQMADQEKEKATAVSRSDEYFAAEPTVLYGKLRLIRQDTVVIASVSEGDSAAFKELGKVRIGVQDITTLRVAAHQGNDEVKVDVRVIDFLIEASQLTPEGLDILSGLWPVVWVLTIGAITGAVALIFWLRMWFLGRTPNG